jgi:putative ABC transport system substrate-binding protein
MNTRRKLVIALGASALAGPFSSFAQHQGKVWRIGILETQSTSMNVDNLNAFRQGLSELGYVEGKNLVIKYRSADGRSDRFPALAAELLQLRIDMIVTRGTPAAIAARNATASIPIVMAASGQPLMVVASLAHPGGNVTGLSTQNTDIETKRLEILRELVPGVTRIAALYDMSNPIFLPRWGQVEVVSKSLGISAQLLDVRKPEDLERAFDAAKLQRANGLIVGQFGLMQANRKLVVELAARHRLPAIYVSEEYIEAGGLIAYGPNYPDLYRRAATYVEKIFNGAKPADLPVEQPTIFQLFINAKTAKALGIKIPDSILVRADKLIE